MQSLKTYIHAKSQNILSFVSFWEHKFEAIQGLSSALFSLLNSFYSAKLRQGHTRGRKWGIQSIILSFFLCPVGLGGILPDVKVLEYAVRFCRVGLYVLALCRER